MQDFPKLCSESDNVSFTALDRLMCFTCVKNALSDAMVKNPPDCALSAESDMYACNAKLLRLAGAKIDEDTDEVTFLGIKRKMGARIVLHPKFGVSLEEMKSKISGNVRVSKKSILVVGGDITLENLEVDGALFLQGAGILKDRQVKNAGRPLVAIPDDELPNVAEDLKIRGYRMDAGEMEQITLTM